MISLNEADLLHMLGAWLWPFLRVSGFALAAPMIGTRTVPMRVRLIFAVVLSAVMSPAIATPRFIDPLSAEGVLTAIHQVAIGAVIGLVIRLLFFVYEFAGQLVAQQMGLGFAAMIDPQSGAQVPVLGQLYIIVATLVFFAVDAHLALLALLAESFEILPVGPRGITALGAQVVLDWSTTLFADALLLGLPVVVALLAVNFSLGVMARAAPQLNIFAVGFPVMILIGVVLVFMTLGTVVDTSEELFVTALAAARDVLLAR